MSFEQQAFDFEPPSPNKQLDLFGNAIKTHYCNKCKQDLPLTLFSNTSGGSYPRSECRPCSSKLAKIRDRLKKQYGNPPEGYLCPICHRNETEVAGLGGKKLGSWVIDHDHNTDEFRNWLCHQCNRGLGNFQEDVERINRAKEYLSKTINT